jgi:SAM-dependent methyltransferase
LFPKDTMYIEKRCFCCDGTDFKEFGALIAPFVASYIWKTSPRVTLLLECRSCGFRFFQERFSKDEIARLYADYRSERYWKARHACEPWYTRAINDGIGGSPAEITFRKKLSGSFIKEHSLGASMASVLDWGGDRGQFIPDDFANKYVFDVSGVQPLDGIVAISSERELGGMHFDVVMLAHVLEHLSDPRSVLQTIRPKLAAGGLLFVEVPYERYDLRFAKRSSAFTSYLGIVAAHPGKLLMALDFFSTACRVRFGVVPPLGFPKLHEHINFFNEASLSKLLEATGYRVLVSRIAPEAKSVVGFQGVLLALAQV